MGQRKGFWETLFVEVGFDPPHDELVIQVLPGDVERNTMVGHAVP